MKAQLQMQTVRKTRSNPSYTPVARAILWHTHVGGQHFASSGGECEECRKKRQGALQRTANNSIANEEPPIVHEPTGGKLWSGRGKLERMRKTRLACMAGLLLLTLLASCRPTRDPLARITALDNPWFTVTSRPRLLAANLNNPMSPRLEGDRLIVSGERRGQCQYG